MALPYLSFKTQILLALSDQLDQIKNKKTLKLNNINSQDTLISELVECVHEFLHSHVPPLEIERLSLQRNQLSSLPKNFYIIASNIRYLDLHNNNFTVFPSNITDCKKLEILDLSSNKLTLIPRHDILQLQNLKVISLKENKFKYLPPALGDLSHLNLIEVADNPLIVPSSDIIKNFQNQSADHDWVNELKQFLRLNSSAIEARISDLDQKALPQKPKHSPSSSGNLQMSNPPNANIPPPPISRSKSISETKTKASKAARRMGLIIKKTDEGPTPSPATPTNNSKTLPSTPDVRPDAANTSDISADLSSHKITLDPSSNGHHDSEPNGSFNDHLESSGATSTTFLTAPHSASDAVFPISPPLLGTTSTATTVPNSQSSSPSATPVPGIKSSLSHSSLSNLNPSATGASLSRSSSRNRSRSNTLKEIDNILEKNDSVDTEHKSGAYFRRLSTLQENPIDETIKSIRNQPLPPLPSNMSSRLGSLSVPSKDQIEASKSSAKSPPAITKGRSPSLGTETSPSKPSPPKKAFSHGSSLIVKVSRKILFSFSELHSSVRRFTGFCIDKKITIKMVSLLYTTKSNIDSLVENLEILEEDGENVDAITNSLYASISSFKSIMTLLSENFHKFVAKIDVCFIRMLYLTIYGTFNELLNAYRILVPAPKLASLTSSLSIAVNGSLDPKAANKPGLTINTSGLNGSSMVNGSANTALTATAAVSTDTDDIDEKLYQTVELATTKAQVVFSELTKAISKSALASTNNPQSINNSVAGKVKELTNICITSMDITKRLRTKLITIRNNPSLTSKKLFWDDVNQFLKAIVNTLGPVKIIMRDLPILNDARAAILNLTKTTKDITILLEVSSYGSLSDSATGQLSSISAQNPSLSSMFTPLTAHPSTSLSLANLALMNNQSQPVRTPLVAALGPAAQAIISSGVVDPAYVTGRVGSVSSPIISPGALNGGMATAPAQSSGQYYAKNGMNPFDGLIMANRDLKDSQ